MDAILDQAEEMNAYKRAPNKYPPAEVLNSEKYSHFESSSKKMDTHAITPQRKTEETQVKDNSSQPTECSPFVASERQDYGSI